MRKVKHIHFVGIGGVGMSGIAEVLLALGYRVSGSDARASETLARLESLGASVRIGHDAAHLTDADVVVFSSAVRPGNPEVETARRRGIPVIPRAEMLAELGRMKYGVLVAGSHGKTTTTSLCAHLLAHAGLDPTVVIGGKVNSLGAGARTGRGELLVAEADESDGSFLKLSPTIAVVTNIDPEHLDHYGDFEHLRRTFLEFTRKVPFFGLAVLCLDHPEVQALLPALDRRHVSYGLSPQADLSARHVRVAGLTTTFEVVRRGRPDGEVTLRMPGAHNVQNALAALAVAEELDVPAATAYAALGTFAGVQRRFTVRGEAAGVMVVDDYGHHPAEIEATLRAAREGFDRRVVVAFQPHRYTRTRDLLAQFAGAFHDAEVLRIAPIYAAGEDPLPGVDAAGLAEAVRERGHRDVAACARDAVAGELAALARPGDLVITLGAGDIWQSGEELLARLRGS